MKKEFGKYSRPQVKQLYTHVYRFTSEQEDFQQIIEEKKLAPLLSCTWANLYDQPFLTLVGLLIHMFDWDEPLKQINQSDDPVDAWFEFSKQQEQSVDEEELTDEDREELKEVMPFLLAVLMAIRGNINAIKQRHRSLSDMMAQVRKGGDKADDILLEAITVDRSVVSCHTAALRISRAQGQGDESFMNRLSKAITRTKPPRPKEHLDDFRIMLEALFDAMGPEGPTSTEVEDILANELQLYGSDNDYSLRALRKQMQKRNELVGT